jgi:hypothetical protein
VATFNNAKSAAHLHKRLQLYEYAHQAYEQAMARYDQLDLMLICSATLYIFVPPSVGSVRSKASAQS